MLFRKIEAEKLPSGFDREHLLYDNSSSQGVQLTLQYSEQAIRKIIDHINIVVTEHHAFLSFPPVKYLYDTGGLTALEKQKLGYKVLTSRNLYVIAYDLIPYKLIGDPIYVTNHPDKNRMGNGAFRFKLEFVDDFSIIEDHVKFD